MTTQTLPDFGTDREGYRRHLYRDIMHNTGLTRGDTGDPGTNPVVTSLFYDDGQLAPEDGSPPLNVMPVINLRYAALIFKIHAITTDGGVLSLFAANSVTQEVIRMTAIMPRNIPGPVVLSSHAIVNYADMDGGAKKEVCESISEQLYARQSPVPREALWADIAITMAQFRGTAYTSANAAAAEAVQGADKAKKAVLASSEYQARLRAIDPKAMHWKVHAGTLGSGRPQA